MQRRLTKIFQRDKIEIYDDYAHHPTEIKSVINGIRKVSNDRKIIIIFQPHRYSRVRNLKKEFASCFKDASHVILCPVYAAGEKKDKKYNQIRFAKMINKFSKTQVITVQNETDITKYLKKNLIDNEIVIGMGAGTISKWMNNLKNNL